MDIRRIPIEGLYSLDNIESYYAIHYDDMITYLVNENTGRRLSATLNPYNGYYYHTMDEKETGDRKKVYAQKVNFLGHVYNGPYEQVNHLDGNKANNSPENLKQCTAKENVRHAYQNYLIDNGKVFMITYNGGLQVTGTTSELFQRMGISPKAVNEIYKGKQSPDPYNIQSIVIVD